MALAATTLNGAVSAGSNKVVLTAFTNPATGGISAKTLLLVNGEKMLVTDASLAPTLEVVRGYAGTAAGASGTLAPVVYGLTSDFNAGSGPGFASYGVDSAIAVPVVDTVVWLTKATAGAYTLAGPARDQQNTVTIISTTAAAHTVTYTAGFFGNTTSSDVATFAATINVMLTLRAQNGTWAIVASSGVTVA